MNASGPRRVNGEISAASRALAARARWRLLFDRRGVSAVEYGLLLVAILLLVAAGYRLLGKGNTEAARTAERTLQGGSETFSAGGGIHTTSAGNDNAPGGTSGEPGSNSSDNATADNGTGTNDGSGGTGGEGAGGGAENGGSSGDKGGGGGGFWGGVGNFFKGAIQGDFGGDHGWSGLAGQVITGFIPVVGQIADVRDTVAGIKAVVQGKPGGWAQLGGAAIAWVPGVGDLAKAGLKGARHADEAAKAAEEVAEGAGKGADEAAEGAGKGADEAAGAAAHSRADAARLLDESEGRTFGNGTGHARAHVPREGQDPAQLAESRRNANGNPLENNTVFRSGRQGEQALRDIMNSRADDLANLRPGDPPVRGEHPFRNTVEGVNSANGQPATRVQIRNATYSIVRLPDGKLHLIHFAPHKD
ncbi:hypothetical protein LVJ94_50625 [Pendulispora rubella]|uniref:Bacterial CdiA-CT RNAse A domain-containing protein n=2 Tax=Pendulispora rubella TaxID=2741070 RepID=A0ABZ2L2G0_9BACT